MAGLGCTVHRICKPRVNPSGTFLSSAGRQTVDPGRPTLILVQAIAEAWGTMVNERTDNSRFQEFGRKVDEHFSDAIPKAEEELKKVITYLNDEVVPQVRQNSSQALRVAADQLTKLAEHLDRRRSNS